MIQNKNKWVITSFQPVAPLSVIIIKGMIDLPANSGPIGIGHITTYSDTDETDIYANGSRIDHI
jgi:hypothetical protein